MAGDYTLQCEPSNPSGLGPACCEASLGIRNRASRATLGPACCEASLARRRAFELAETCLAALVDDAGGSDARGDRTNRRPRRTQHHEDLLDDQPYGKTDYESRDQQ